MGKVLPYLEILETHSLPAPVRESIVASDPRMSNPTSPPGGAFPLL